MSLLDAELVYRSIAEDTASRIDQFEVFAEIDSTNSCLMEATAPAAGKVRVAITDNQTAGRGRRGRRWQSPPGSGLCLSTAYTFASAPDELPALTLAIGIGVIEALETFDIRNVCLKWPNDLVLDNAKLGGILTELRQQGASDMTVVSGVGINLELQQALDIRQGSEWTTRAIDLRAAGRFLPSREALAARLIEKKTQVFRAFDADGFAAFEPRWDAVDWLSGREIEVDADGKKVRGIGAGIDTDGALLVDTPTSTERVISGSVSVAGLVRDSS